MNIKSILLILTLTFFCAVTLQAQKIAHANIDLVLSLMPETQSMAQTLKTYQTQLSKKLEVKRQYAGSKLAEAEEKAKANAPESELDKYREELTKLDKEIQEEAADAEQKLAQKRMDLMEPITTKLEKAIKDVSATEGYDYILNSVDGSGVSIVLHGPEDRDLTKKILTKLNIAIPAELEGK